MARRNRNTNSGAGRTGVITFVMVVVTLVWATSVIAEIINPEFEMTPGVQEVMMLGAGALFSMRQVSASRESDEEDEDEHR